MFGTSKETKKVGKVIGVYGEGGVGKTTIIAQAIKSAKKGLFVQCGEDGLSPLQQTDTFCDLTGIETLDSVIKSWTRSKELSELNMQMASGAIPEDEYKKRSEAVEGGLIELLYWLATQDYTDVAFDSVSLLSVPLEEWAFVKYFLMCPNEHGGTEKTPEELRVKADAFGKSELLSKMEKEFDELLRAIRYLRDKGVNVYFTSHTAIKKQRVLGDDAEYDYAHLDFQSNKNVSLATQLYNVADAVLYAKHDVIVAKKNKTTIATGSNDRVLVTEGTVTAKAKNRFNMPKQIPATWEEVSKYLV